MNILRMHYCLSVLLLVLSLTPLSAQFSGGVFLDAGQEKAQLLNRTWHISSKATSHEYLVGVVNDDELKASTNLAEAFSQFVVESAPDDNQWWTADGQWFYLRSATTGLYVTIFGTAPGAPVGLAPIDSTGADDHQRFRAIASATNGWYKLRSRLSDTGAGIVLEVGPDQRLYAATPQADPSEEQKFGFNLGLPLQPEIPFCLMELNSSDFMSNLGTSAPNASVYHIRSSDFSCYWKFLPAGNGFYFLQNLTSGQYLSNLGNTDAGEELFMSTVQDDAARWELLASRHTFQIRNKLSGYYLGTKAQNLSGNPLYQTTSATLGREWRVLHMNDLQPDILTGDYHHILEGSLPASNCAVYGPGFKRALAERAGLPPDEAYFPLLRAALGAHLGDPNLVDRALQNFSLNNPGHRVELAHALGKYLLDNVCKRSRGTWTTPEFMAIDHFTGKIMQKRVAYAGNLQTALQDFLASNAGNPPSFLALWFQVLNSEDFVWPDIYNASPEEAARLREFASAARTLNFRNNHLKPTLSNTFSTLSVAGLGLAVNIALSSKYPVGVQQLMTATLKLEVSSAFEALDEVGQQVARQALARSASFATFAANAVIIIDVAIIAAQSLAIEAQKVADLEILSDDVNYKAFKQIQPLFMDLVMQGYNELDKLQLIQDLDFMLATAGATGFENNYNDTQYFQAFNLLCYNQATVTLDANGEATLQPAGTGFAAPICAGDDVEYSLSNAHFNCAALGSNNQVTLTARNAAYTASCTVPVTVEEHIPPTVHCKDITVSLGSAGTTAIGASAIFQSGSDNCSSVVHLADISNPTVYWCDHIGMHTLTLTVDDFHGNTATCQAVVTVVDDVAPSIVCPPAQVVGPTSVNPAVAILNNLNPNIDDNCTAAPALSFVRSGASSGSGTGNVNGLSFNFGNSTVVYTVTDDAGLSSSCSFTVKVGSGGIYWEHDPAQGVGGATVTLSGDQSATTTTQANGVYGFAITTGSSFTLTPTKNTGKLNGVTSADVTAIQQHVANTALLPAPFKRIAADVNKSNSVNTLDASLLQQALLGNPAALAQITAWRFVPAAHTFPNPDIPWGFPEKIIYNGPASSLAGKDFLGIKLGDVSSTWANPANFGKGEPLVFSAPDQALQAGALLELEFSAGQLDALASFQCALHVDPERLQLLDIEPLDGLPLTPEHFGTYRLAEGELRIVWSQAAPLAVPDAAPLFRLRFRALQGGTRLSEVLRLDETELPARCYNSAYAESGVELHFLESTPGHSPTGAPVFALSASPNPFGRHTLLTFSLPEAGEAGLRVFDATGRLLLFKQQHYAAGEHRERLDLEEGVTGVLFAELQSGGGKAVQRLVCLH